MSRQIIDIGSAANDGTGDSLRVAFDKINDNSAELYSRYVDLGTFDLTSHGSPEFELTDLDDYDEIELAMVAVDKSGAAGNWRTHIRISEDNGATYIDTSTYAWAAVQDVGVTYSPTEAKYSADNNNAAARMIFLRVSGLKSAGPVFFQNTFVYSDESQGGQRWGVCWGNSGPINAIKLFHIGATDNYDTGTVYVRGVR